MWPSCATSTQLQAESAQTCDRHCSKSRSAPIRSPLSYFLCPLARVCDACANMTSQQLCKCQGRRHTEPDTKPTLNVPHRTPRLAQLSVCDSCNFDLYAAEKLGLWASNASVRIVRSVQPSPLWLMRNAFDIERFPGTYLVECGIGLNGDRLYVGCICWQACN